jgi:hypothetical protein
VSRYLCSKPLGGDGGDVKTRKIFEAERHPERKRNINRETEYQNLGIPNETLKVGVKPQ